MGMAEWRWGDSHRIAKLNPLRWSGGKTIDVIVEELEKEREQHSERPVVVRTPPGIRGTKQKCESLQEAIDHVTSLCPARKLFFQAALKASQTAREEEKEAEAAKENLSPLQQNILDAQERPQAAQTQLDEARNKAEESKAAVKVAEAE